MTMTMKIMWAAASLSGLLLCLRTESTLAADRGSHPCSRQCVKDQPMTCGYNFTLEWYRTLGKACYDCPFNVTDCYRQECIAGDGKVRLVMAVNRQVPGPPIEVCEGDVVEVRLTNMLEDGLSTSMHWHGQHVFKEPYFDGVGQVTQCNIGHQETFVYKFHAGPVGTHWYHTHTAMQLMDGAFGPLIVRQARGEDPNDGLYDHDLSEHVLTVYNWLPELSMQYFLDVMHIQDPTRPQSVMVNGRARYYNVTNPYGVIKTNLTHAQTPLEVVHVKRGQKYRLRFIGASSACPLQISVDGHQLTVISEDGMPLKPRDLDAFLIFPGERYDFVLNANQTVGNYWMRVIGLGDCEPPKANGMAIVRYEGAPLEDPTGDPSLQRDGILLNPLPSEAQKTLYGFNRSTIMIDDLRHAHPTNYTDERVDLQFFIALDQNQNDNTKYNNKDLYPVQSLPPRLFHKTPVMDNITFMTPPTPLLSQREDIREDWFCNRSTLEDPAKCLHELCMCVHTLRVPLNKVVEIIIYDRGALVDEGLEDTFMVEVGHPVHIHGHNFRLLGFEKVGRYVDRGILHQMDKGGRLKRNFISPPVRDTVNIPDGGYALFRFNANNPGFWFFHCHTDVHLQQGMGLLFKVGDHSDLPPVPDEFPRCGGMGFSNARQRQPPDGACPTGAAGVATSSIATVFFGSLWVFCVLLAGMF